MEFKPLDSDESAAQQAQQEWLETLTRTVAHLAAQVTITQVRLRALASELDARGGVDQTAVARRVAEIAQAETGSLLRENLGVALTEAIEADALEAEIIAWLAEG